MTDVMTAITTAGVSIAGYASVAVAAGIGVAIVVYGAKRAWGAFKSMR
jgi:hypothetical protein